MKKYTLAAMTALVTALPLHAQTAGLPDAKTLTSKYASAVGGDAMLKMKVMKTTGTFEMPSQGISAPIEILRGNPNMNMVRITIPGMGEVVQGYNGSVGFSMNPMAGNQLVSGKELESLAEEAQIGANLRQPQYFTSMETVDTASFGGVKCYKVKLVWKSGRTSYDCYDKETGLMTATMRTQDTPNGPLEVTNVFSNYKQFNGVTVPTKMVQTVMGMEQVMTFDKVEFDTVDAATAFALPAAIQALVPKK